MANGAAPGPAVFLDRDGTVTEEVGYLNHLSRFRLLPGVVEAIRRLNKASVPVIVVTNKLMAGLVHDVHERLKAELLEGGAQFDGVYYCPHVSADELRVSQAENRNAGTGRARTSVGLEKIVCCEAFWCAPDSEKVSLPGTRKIGRGSRNLSLRICPKL